MQEKEKELETKLKEVNDQLSQQSVIDELKQTYEEQLQAKDNEQLLITQVCAT